MTCIVITGIVLELCMNHDFWLHHLIMVCKFCNGKFMLQGLSGLPGMALFTSEVEENDSRSEQIMCCVFLTSVPLMTVLVFSLSEK